MHFQSKQQVFDIRKSEIENGTTFPVLTFASWEILPGIRHCFTTRAGGVSEGYLASLNFRRDSYDTQENILENLRRIALYFDTTPDRIVSAHQTHTANVRIVTEADAGKGAARPLDYTDIDGLITDVPGLVLFTTHADCPPLYFYDPVRRVIALSHSGWKGTVARIGAVTIRKMQDHFGCRPEDIYAAIGPSICRDCYEISEDVAEPFRACFGKSDPAASASGPSETNPDALKSDSSPVDTVPGSSKSDSSPLDADSSVPAEDSGTLDTEHGVPKSDSSPLDAATDSGTLWEIPRILARGKNPGKYQLDLWAANARILLEAGITPDHLTVTNLCTCENSTELFSHRATGGKRGLQGAFLMLED